MAECRQRGVGDAFVAIRGSGCHEAFASRRGWCTISIHYHHHNNNNKQAVVVARTTKPSPAVLLAVARSEQQQSCARRAADGSEAFRAALDLEGW